MSGNNLIIIGLLFYSFLFLSFKYNNISLSVTFLDVGQGDSAILNLGNLGYIMIDGGTDLSVDDSILSFMTYPLCKIRFFYISHFHADHIKGLPNIVARCLKSFTTFNDISGYSYSKYNFDNIFSKNSFIKLPTDFSKTVQSGQVFSYKIFGKPSIDIYILWPPREVLKIKDENDRSLIMLVNFGSYEILFTGDASGEIIDSVLTPAVLKLIDGNLEVYKVPHHGSTTGRSKSVLSKLRPLHCVISVGANKFGHPSPQVLEDLEGIGCRVHITKQEGNIEFML
jgi:competence protein ComEC